jgi:hypothetical protein
MRPIMELPLPYALLVVGGGFIGGLLLLIRGLVAYRRDRLVEAIATSSLGAVAAGEVRVTGVVEPVAMTLVSPIQSKPCVWYRARIEETGEDGRVLLNEERTHEFDLRDESSRVRIVPKGARWEIGPAFDASTDMTGDEPPGLALRTGSTFALIAERDPAVLSELDRDAAIQELLTVRPPRRPMPSDSPADGTFLGARLASGTKGKRYREWRLEPGATVTVIGEAMPWSDLREAATRPDPTSNEEREIASDIADARAAGLLVGSPSEAWGNAAIPGFGIGRPTEVPDLEPRAIRPDIVEHTEPSPVDRYLIGVDELVIARGRGPLAVYAGSPDDAEEHHDASFVLGLVGAVMSVMSIIAFGFLVAGRPLP